MPLTARQSAGSYAPANEPEDFHSTLAGKRILITGAGGWIGSALARTLSALPPEQRLASMVLLDASEGNLYAIDAALRAHAPATPHTSILGSVTDAALLAELFSAHQPQIVFHAAAYKHVPLLEANPLAALSVNALGTQTLVTAAHRANTETFVLLSTDKAANPCGILGASKRIAEIAVLNASGAARLQCKALRLVNVLGSPGSVLPLWQEQIARGGPLTVTDARAERYFVSLEEAVALLFTTVNAALPAGLYLPHIGAPVRILDLARQCLAEHASTAEIVFTGLRAGEKLTESLLAAQEQYATENAPGTAHPSLRRVQTPLPPRDFFLATMHALQAALARRDASAALDCMRQLVPGYPQAAHYSARKGAKVAPSALTGVRA